MKLRSGLAAFGCLALATSFAQTVPHQLSEAFSSGVVVEKVAKNLAGEEAGIREGDILLTWSRGDVQGEIWSPFDLAALEIEQAPRGTVALDGVRGAEKKTWTMGPDAWGLTVRPALDSASLKLYREGQKLSMEGKLPEAARLWRSAAEEAKGAQAAWLSFHIAQSLAEARQWATADVAFQQAVQQTNGEATMAAQTLRAWAATFQQRSDWANAAKYYQQIIDSRRKAGIEDLTTAQCLYDLGTIARAGKDLVAAEAYLRQALALREKLAPGSLAVAANLTGLGVVVADRGDSAGADQYQQRALEIQEKLAPGGAGIVITLTNLGLNAWQRGDGTATEKYLLQALAIQEKIDPDSLALANNLTTLGLEAFERGDLAHAEQLHRRALAIREKRTPDGEGVAKSLSNIALALRERGDVATAEAYLRRALAIKQRLGSGGVSLASTLTNLGLVLADRGDFDEAEDDLRQALEIFERVSPGSLDVAGRLNNLGSVATSRGNLAQAESYQRRALEIQEKLAPGSPDCAWSLNNLGTVLLARGELTDAEQSYRQALAIREKFAPRSLSVAQTLHHLGDVVYQRGDAAAAEQYYGRALAIRAQLAPGSIVYAETLASLAHLKHGGQQLDAARQYFAQALDALESQTARLGGGEEVRASFRARYGEFYHEYVDLLVMQGDPEVAFQVLERSRARTLLETLATAHVDIRKGADPALIAKERSLEAEIKAKSERRIQLLSDKHNEEQINAVENEISALTSEYQNVESQIRSSSPVYAALTQPQPLTATQIQHDLLDRDTLALEYSLGEERSYVFAVAADSLQAFELPKRADVEKAARLVYGLVTERNRDVRGETVVRKQRRWARAEAEYPQAVANLGRMVLGPVASQLGGKRLLIVADGALQYVPFTILPEPAANGSARAPLVANHEVINLPSASVLAVLRQQAMNRRPPPKMVAVLADPVFTKDDPRLRPAGAAKGNASATRSPGRRGSAPQTASDPLPSALLTRSAADVGLGGTGRLQLPRLRFSRQEANAILAVTPQGLQLKALDFQANRSTATSPELSRYRIVHFATHGLLDSQHPELSGLVLSLVNEEGQAEDGFLELQDIYNLNLPADLVVLSACETGLGKEISGEGLVGLTRGFMYAGASRVVASLWNVSDAATARLMADFYRAMEQDGLRPAAALRAAQIRMRKQKRWNSPYFWAAFQIQGEWK